MGSQVLKKIGRTFLRGALNGISHRIRAFFGRESAVKRGFSTIGAGWIGSRKKGGGFMAPPPFGVVHQTDPWESARVDGAIS
jgi:hypothetical protein